MQTKFQTRIDRRLAELRAAGRKGLVAYLAAGDGGLAVTAGAVLRLEDAGADVIELGVPFSDPLADGRVNQAAAQRALAAGTTLPKLLDMVAALRRRTEIPLLLFSYLNPLYARGFARAAREAAAAGVDGMLLLDLAIEEAGEFAAALRRNRLSRIGLVTPTSPPARIRRVVDGAGGFVYCVSRAGVTGAQRRLDPGAAGLVRRVRRCTPLPLALGFGIASPEQAAVAARAADAVVVGSAIVERMHRDGPVRAAAWVRRLARAVHAA